MILTSGTSQTMLIVQPNLFAPEREDPKTPSFRRRFSYVQKN